MTRDHVQERLVLQALTQLLVLTPVERERWYDHHVLGVSHSDIARRDVCTRQAVRASLRRSNRKLQVTA